MARLSQNSSIVILSSAFTVHSADQLDTCACLCSSAPSHNLCHYVCLAAGVCREMSQVIS
jgi:hypothetical protein